MFSIKNLTVTVGGKTLIDSLSLELQPGTVHAVMGPNGAGKSSLAEALMGNPVLVVSGSIILDGDELVGTQADERARKGVFLAFQNPQEVEGLKVGNFIRKAVLAKESTGTESSGKSTTKGGKSVNDLDKMVRIHESLVHSAETLALDKSFVSRELNVGFSGGEKKRLEMLQMLALKPKVVIMDEIDSGLDVDGIKAISVAINGLREQMPQSSFLIITHYPRILKHVVPDFVHVLSGGKIVRSGNAQLAHEIEEHGYSKFVK